MSEDVAPIVSGPQAGIGLGTRSPRPFPRASAMGVPLDACSAERREQVGEHEHAPSIHGREPS